MKARSLFLPIILALLAAAFLTACNRPATTPSASTPTAVQAEAETVEQPITETIAAPTIEPTVEPTHKPTAKPTTAAPAEEPTVEPTEEPTQEPVEQPTEEPTEQPTAEPEPTQEPTEPATQPITHTVQANENLYRIGLLYNLSWTVLAQANNISDPNDIVVGQEILIPTEGLEPPPPLPTTHIVQPGENLFRIGLIYGMTWDIIAQANNLADPNDIPVGLELIIPEKD